MKATKRLVKALIALAASIVLCIGVCLAWFASNASVEANDLSERIKSTNIIQFDIEAYKLTDKTIRTVDGATVTTFTVGDKRNGDLIKMAEYGGLVGNSDTAILLKFTYTFDDTLGRNYAIYADCKDMRKEVDANSDTGELRLECALSSVINFYGMSGEGTTNSTVTQQTEITGEAVPDTDSTFITLKGGISDSEKNGTFYCIVDYVEDKIFSQYYQALTIDGTTLSTPMDFLPDIEFYIGESSAA